MPLFVCYQDVEGSFYVLEINDCSHWLVWSKLQSFPLDKPWLSGNQINTLSNVNVEIWLDWQGFEHKCLSFRIGNNLSLEQALPFKPGDLAVQFLSLDGVVLRPVEAALPVPPVHPQVVQGGVAQLLQPGHVDPRTATDPD